MWEYKVAYGLGLKELQREVNKLLSEGWMIEGNLTVLPLGTNLQAFQTLTRYVDV